MRTASKTVRAWATTFALCAFALSTTVFASAAPARAATAEDTPAISWTACGDRLECADVSVPLDWDHPGGKKIDLAVIRHLASNPQARIGSAFINPGGPGESGVDMVRDSGDLLDAWGGGRFDLVGWDPRGTNASTPVQCFTSEASEAKFWQGIGIPTTPTESRTFARKLTALSGRCKQVSGDLMFHISTEDTARDLEALRQGVGDEKLTYIGLSYGTMLGRVYAHLFPTHVRAMMLDSVINEQEYYKSAEARTGAEVGGVDVVFDQFLALCQGAGPAGCALAGHPETVKARVDRLFEDARHKPIPAPNADPPGALSYGDLLLTTFTPMRDPNMWPDYAAQLDAAASGDASALKDTARLSLAPAVFTKATTISAAIQCDDAAAKEPLSAWPEVMKKINTRGVLWGPVLGWWQWAPCAANRSASTDHDTGPWNSKTANPILLIGNVYDPATPYYGAQNADKTLGNSVLLTLAGYGHPSYQLPSQCLDAARVNYLVDIFTPPAGTVCAADEAPFQSAAPPSAHDTNTDEVPSN